jgi:hypothetical protein
VKALSLRSPWWWAILYAGKRLENRDWTTPYRGPLLLHASQWWSLEEVGSTLLVDIKPRMTEAHLDAAPRMTLRQMREMGGHLVGSCRVVGCVRPGDPIPEGQADWYQGSCGLLLADARPLVRPVRCKGALGLFEVPADVAAQVEVQP